MTNLNALGILEEMKSAYNSGEDITVEEIDFGELLDMCISAIEYFSLYETPDYDNDCCHCCEEC